MATPSGRRFSWWDRELDHTGRLIRADVRTAAHEIWGQACDRVQALLGDTSDAAGLMEKSVAQVSRYLDRIGSAPFAENANGLLVSAFCRALRRYASKLRRIELVGDLSEFKEQTPARSCSTKEDCRLDAEKAARHLSHRGRMMLEFRRVGFEWKEIAEILKMTDTAARAEFSRELKRARLQVRNKCPGSGAH
jgi:hypothetical protein